MIKHYFYITCLLFSLGSLAQESKNVKNQDGSSESLGVYPNPVSNGKVFVYSKNTLSKEIVIFDVLGKIVLQTTLNTKELNVSVLPAGIYIIKIKEGELVSTRKLVIR